MARFFLLSCGVLALVPVAALALEPKDLAGLWIAKWPNNTQNSILLGYGDGRLSGTYLSDEKFACPVAGSLGRANNRIELNVRCPSWSIQMQGIVSGDGLTINGSYKAYMDAAGDFVMQKR